MQTPYENELGNVRSAISFGNRRIEAEYRTHLAHRSEVNVRRQLLIGLLMISGITALDFFLTDREFAITSLSIRLTAMVPAILLVYGLTYLQRALWIRQPAAVICALAVALSSLAIAEIGRRTAQPAIAGGYFVVILFTYFFIGLRYPIAVATSFLLVAIFVAVAVIGGGTNGPVIVYAGYNLFFFSGICALGAGQLELARRRDFLTKRILSYRAGIDELSGVANRRAFDSRLEKSWQEATDSHKSLVLMMIDIDHFKAYNDRYGHQAGDRAICSVADVLKQQLRRPCDFVARYGGEEFAVILTDVNPGAALKLAERIRAQVIARAIEHEASDVDRHVTVSIGVTHIEPYRTERSPQGFVQMADEALYSAKNQGRNCVVDSADIASFEETGVFSLEGQLELTKVLPGKSRA